jgi:hypothetical protein
MNFLRAVVAATVIVLATPAFAQGEAPGERHRRREVPQVRTLITGYSGIHGRFIYGRPGIGWPVVHPRIFWVVDEFIEEGRPLGFSRNAYGYSSFARPRSTWSDWPYYAAGRDAAPPAPTTPKAESEAAISEGRARWKAGDTAGALASFKKAVAEDLKSGTARLYMALALLATGDPKNADKALVSALDLIRGREEVAALTIDGLFRNPKERAKFEAKLTPAGDGTGSLTIALAQHLLGLKAKAARTLDGLKDPAANRVAELIR